MVSSMDPRWAGLLFARLELFGLAVSVPVVVLPLAYAAVAAPASMPRPDDAPEAQFQTHSGQLPAGPVAGPKGKHLRRTLTGEQRQTASVTMEVHRSQARQG
jgi:hypothetical protein